MWGAHPRLATIFFRRLAQVVADRIRVANSYLDEILTDETPILQPDLVVGAHSLLYQAGEES